MATCLVCCDAAATVYCCNDDASLCKACSAKIHSANLVAARHTLLPLCVVCNVAPPTVYCRNDDAFLCSACDQEAHTGLLASRHERIPAATASKEGVNKMAEEVFAESSSAANSEVAGMKQAEPANDLNDFNDLVSLGTDFGVVPVFAPQPEQQQDETPVFGKDMFDKDGLDIDAGWLDRLDMGFDFSDILADSALPELPTDDAGLVPTISGGFPGDDLALPSTSGYEAPAYIPAAAAAAKAAPAVPQVPARKRKTARSAYEESDEDLFEDDEEQEDDCSDDDFDLPASKARKQARTIVAARTPEGPGLLYQLPAALVHVSTAQAAINRAERIAKCRDKRKNRKFEKTIRYATRKAYAEVRPRIKGRFVKKEELEAYYATYGRPGGNQEVACA